MGNELPTLKGAPTYYPQKKLNENEIKKATRLYAELLLLLYQSDITHIKWYIKNPTAELCMSFVKKKLDIHKFQINGVNFTQNMKV